MLNQKWKLFDDDEEDFWWRGTNLWESARCLDMWGSCLQRSVGSWSRTEETAAEFSHPPPRLSDPLRACCVSPVSPWLLLVLKTRRTAETHQVHYVQSWRSTSTERFPDPVAIFRRNFQTLQIDSCATFPDESAVETILYTINIQSFNYCKVQSTWFEYLLHLRVIHLN